MSFLVQLKKLTKNLRSSVPAARNFSRFGLKHR